MAKKLSYRIRNWAEYNTALIQRGNIDAIQKWIATKTKRKGRPKLYSDDAILCALLLRAVYHLPLRAVQGFLCALVSMLALSLPIPNYTRVCRRAQSLGQGIKRLCGNRKITDIVIRHLSKLHLLAKIALFGIFAIKFFDHVFTHALKILCQICAKIANFIKQSEVSKDVY